MRYPENLKIGDTIGICAPSAGIAESEKIEKLEAAEKQLKEMGYKIKETKSVRKDENGRSASGKIRAKELMELLEDDDVKLIICATGGDFLIDILDYLDFEKLKNIKPKWIQGFSDITGISFLWNTILEIPSMYCQTIKDYAMRPLFKNLTDALEIESGKEIIQKSFPLHEKSWDELEEDLENMTKEAEGQNKNIIEDLDISKDPNSINNIESSEELNVCNLREETYQYNLTEKTEWKNLYGKRKIKIKGRTLGGCLDIIREFFGTKYDNINNYIEKHKEEGIIWFLECFEMTSPEVYRVLWQMKNAGYFNNCSGIIFGRPCMIREDYGMSFNQAVEEILESLDIPIICDADIGHIPPQMAIVNGGILEITSEDGKGVIKTYHE